MNQPDKPTPPKKREHRFSPHTDQCIYCGKSAEDDAIENLPCGSDEPAPCAACSGKGWFFFSTSTDQTPHYEVQRCDVCELYPSDRDALEAMEKAALAQPTLLKFVEAVAGLKHEREPDEDGTVSEHPSEDYIATLNQLILDACKLLGTADQCHECGAVVPYVIGCPDGTELCQDCFDSGQH